MKLRTILMTGLTILGLASSIVEARPHRHHGPRVSFGFNVGAPVVYARPCYATPCGYCGPVAIPAPVVYAPYIRPSFGVSFGSGFGFSF